MCAFALLLRLMARQKIMGQKISIQLSMSTADRKGEPLGVAPFTTVTGHLYEHEGVSLVVHQWPGGSKALNNLWGCTEATTGRKVTRAAGTQKEIFALIHAVFDKKGSHAFNTVVALSAKLNSVAGYKATALPKDCHATA